MNALPLPVCRNCASPSCTKPNRQKRRCQCRSPQGKAISPSPFFIPNLNKSSAAVWAISSTGCSEEGPIHIEWNSEWPDGVTNGIAHLFCGGHNIDALPISLRPTVYACGLLLFLVFDDRNTQFIYFSILSWQFGGRREITPLIAIILHTFRQRF